MGNNLSCGIGLSVFALRNCEGLLRNITLKSNTRVFSDGPLNFESQSSDEDDTRAGIPFPNFQTTPTEYFELDRFNVRQSLNTVDLQWHESSNS
ncbi:hypothetical protein TNCV_4807661 [Trichonephila clavipes]|nr:hypothetical protein TNCV_4807661 [Trichonephila clavipes]